MRSAAMRMLISGRFGIQEIAELSGLSVEEVKELGTNKTAQVGKDYIDIIKKKIPTIFLTARDDENDIVKGLELGAEDYITKPFSTKELIARINKVLSRGKNQIIHVKDIEFDMDKMQVYKAKKAVELSNIELKILHLLFLNLNKVVTRDEIIEKIWDWTGNDVNNNTVTVYMKRIREKLEEDIIVTIKGIGYRIDGE